MTAVPAHEWVLDAVEAGRYGVLFPAVIDSDRTVVGWISPLRLMDHPELAVDACPNVRAAYAVTALHAVRQMVCDMGHGRVEVEG